MSASMIRVNAASLNDPISVTINSRFAVKSFPGRA